MTEVTSTEKAIEKGFILITYKHPVNSECHSESYRLLDSNRNYVTDIGKSKYAAEIVERETTGLKTADELEQWFLNPNRKLDELKDQDKRNLISIAEFTLHAHNSTEFYYYVVDSQQGNLGGIEEEKFNSLDEVVERLEVYFIDIFHVDREF